MKMRHALVRAARTFAGSFFLGLGSALLGVPDETFDEWMLRAFQHNQKGSGK
jgi:hypothetical protein